MNRGRYKDRIQIAVQNKQNIVTRGFKYFQLYINLCHTKSDTKLSTGNATTAIEIFAKCLRPTRQPHAEIFSFLL
jgi:hypothetical protein